MMKTIAIVVMILWKCVSIGIFFFKKNKKNKSGKVLLGVLSLAISLASINTFRDLAPTNFEVNALAENAFSAISESGERLAHVLWDHSCETCGDSGKCTACSGDGTCWYVYAGKYPCINGSVVGADGIAIACPACKGEDVCTVCHGSTTCPHCESSEF